MGTLDQAIPAVGPQTAAQWADEINTELAELYKRSLAVVGLPAGTNNYTGSIPLNRPIEDGNGLIFRVPNSNTGPCDLNGISMVTPTGAALQTGQLLTGMEIILIRHQASNTYRVHTPLTGGTAPIMRVYATPGTFTWSRPNGLRAVKVRVQAAGGGASTTRPCSGAGSGGYGEGNIPVSALPATVTIVVGTGGTIAATVGNTGGASSFGSFITTNGGLGGRGGTFELGGAGGAIGTGGDVNLPGMPGFPTLSASSPTIGGSGGNSPFGGAGGQATSNSSGGFPGVFGGGGSGAVFSGNGGPGGNGIVTVEEIY